VICYCGLCRECINFLADLLCIAHAEAEVMARKLHHFARVS
jgi:hypothetical protein